MFGNQISHVDDGAFSDLVALEELNLGMNKLTCLSDHTFHSLDNLLVLTQKSITTITPSSNSVPLLFKSIIKISKTSTGLRKLDVSGNHFKIFSITANVFPHLQTLHLSFSGPYENGSMEWDVPDRYFLRNVSSLDLSWIHMSIEMMSMVLQSLNSLVNLKLNHTGVLQNYIIELSELSFRSMKQLRILLLGKNILSSVPNATRNFPTLEILDLSGNRIIKLGCSDFANLTRFTELYLDFNKNMNFEGCVFQDLGALKPLALGNNLILALDGAFN
ncbi:unnamed protein product [Coregonus sp. 'balchen']|nr:unnamed protein product [Coregonus sp. 'balchen']